MNTLTVGPLATNTDHHFSFRCFLKASLTVAVLASIGATAWKLNQELDLTGSMRSTAFLLSTLLAVIYRITNPAGWALVLRGFGHPVSTASATQVWLHAESRRWLPGGVWGYASRAVQSQALGVPVSVASASMLVELLLTIAAATLVGAVGVTLHWDRLASTIQQIMLDTGVNGLHFAGGLAVVMVLGGIGYAVRKKLQCKLAGLSAKLTALQRIQVQTGPLAASVGYFVVMACLNGLVNLTLVQAIDVAASVPVMAMIAATAVAWIVGFLAFFSPGGILVREATLAAILLPWMPYEVGFSLAMLSRLAQLIAEVIGMAIVMLPAKRHS
jgi:hypothetical protein